MRRWTRVSLKRITIRDSVVVLAMHTRRSNSPAIAGQSLHSLASGNNPYKSVISIIAKTLSAFDDDQLIPMYGFGDVQSRDKALLSFSPNNQPLHGLDAVLHAYQSSINAVQLSGPTSFAPAIWRCIQDVRESGGQYHILLIIADGQER